MNGEETLSAVPGDEERRTVLCKCGKKAEYIKDYWVTESKVVKEKDQEETVSRKLESPCGIIRRRYCPACLSKTAERQRAVNGKLNIKISVSVMLPLLLAIALAAVSYIWLNDGAAVVTAVAFGVMAVAAVVILTVFLGSAQLKRKKIAGGNFSDLRAVDILFDSLNFGIDEGKKVKEIPSVDVLVDGDGRVNYDMERSGYRLKVIYNGKISLEPMRQRIMYPFTGDAEYIKKAYTIAGFLSDNIKSGIIKELTENDFDIRNGVLHRYSGLAVEIEIPENVTKIAYQAFKKSKNCEKIIIPDSVTEIEKEAFLSCPASEIVLPQNIKRISSFCFYGSAVRKVIIPDGVEEIEDNAFGECYGLEAVTVPESCKKIGEAAFKGCASLSEAKISEGIESVGDYCFNGCVSLKKIVIPEGCCEIGNFAFEGCKELEEVFLPDSIQFVGGRAFEGDVKLSIVGKENSFAEKFASEQRLRFTALTESKFRIHHQGRKL